MRRSFTETVFSQKIKINKSWTKRQASQTPRVHPLSQTTRPIDNLHRLPVTQTTGSTDKLHRIPVTI